MKSIFAPTSWPAGLVLLACLALPTTAQVKFGQTATLQMPKNWERHGTIVRDVNLDGRHDLVVAAAEADNLTVPTQLRIHLQRTSGAAFSTTPDFQFDLPRDVIGFSVGDLTPDEGCEVLLVSAKTALIWQPKRSGKERFHRVGSIDLLWQSPRKQDVMGIPKLVRDLDGDGLDDILIPEPGGYRVFSQRRSGQELKYEGGDVLTSGPKTGGNGTTGKIRGKFKFALPIAGEAREKNGLSGRPSLIEIRERVPAPWLVDFDADGDLDILGRREDTLQVFSQQGKGRFDTRPTMELPTPLVVDRARSIDVSYSSHFLDLDGDDRCDCVTLGGDQNAKEARTQVLFYRQKSGRGDSARTTDQPLFGPKGLPTQLLVLIGFAGQTHFADVNGDKAPDFVVSTLRPDLIDVISSSGKEKIEIELLVYLNRKGSFPNQPDFRRKLKIKVEGFKNASRQKLARFFSDLTGDGTAELIVRDRPDRLSIYLTKKNRDGSIQVFDKPLATLETEDDAVLLISDDETPGPPYVVALEDTRIRFLGVGR